MMCKTTSVFKKKENIIHFISAHLGENTKNKLATEMKYK